MILGFINKTDLTWQDRFPSDLVGLWVVFFRRVASRCSQRKKPWNEMKSCSFSDQEVYTGFLEKGAQRKEAEHLQHVGGDENAPTVAAGGLYLKGAGQSAALFMQRRLSFCSASHHRCARCWLSLFILFARSDFLTIGWSLCLWFLRFLSTWAVSVLQHRFPAADQEFSRTHFDWFWWDETKLDRPGGKLKFSANCWHLGQVQRCSLMWSLIRKR